MRLPLFLLGTVFCGSVVSEYHYSCGESELFLPNSSLAIQFNGFAIGEATLTEDAPVGTIHDVSIGHHFCQQDWYLTSRNGASWELLPGKTANMSRASLLPASSTRNLQKRGLLNLVLSFGINAVARVALNLICCGSAVESGLQDVGSLNDSGYEFAVGATFDVVQQPVDAVVGFFNQAGGSVGSVVADPGVTEVFQNIAFYALEIFLD
jgi:hypothetical protein